MRLMCLTTVLMLAVYGAACDDDGGSDGAPSDSGTTASAQPTANPSVVRSFTDGSASASVIVAGQSHGYEGGTCTVGDEDEYIAVNIGEVGGTDYFGVLAGRSPRADADTRSTAGGGEFTGSDVLITIVADGNSFLLRSADTVLNLEGTLTSGTFTSVLAEGGAEVRGEFAC